MFLELLQDRVSIIMPEQQNQSAIDSLAQLPTNQEQNLGIQFVDVSFKYKDDSSWVLRNCSFLAPANATTLVVGRSGCGKTTIARIILGFWLVNEGQVYVDGKGLNSWDLGALRKRMSYV